MEHAASCGAPRRGGIELADIVRDFGAALRATHPVRPEQLAVLRAVERCRTASLGGHLEICAGCGFERPVYNSCRNRHCPKCQGAADQKWIDARTQRLLDTRHYHGVFTLPYELRPLALCAPTAITPPAREPRGGPSARVGRDRRSRGRRDGRCGGAPPMALAATWAPPR